MVSQSGFRINSLATILTHSNLEKQNLEVIRPWFFANIVNKSLSVNKIKESYPNDLNVLEITDEYLFPLFANDLHQVANGQMNYSEFRNRNPIEWLKMMPQELTEGVNKAIQNEIIANLEKKPSPVSLLKTYSTEITLGIISKEEIYGLTLSKELKDVVHYETFTSRCGVEALDFLDQEQRAQISELYLKMPYQHMASRLDNAGEKLGVELAHVVAVVGKDANNLNVNDFLKKHNITKVVDDEVLDNKQLERYRNDLFEHLRGARSIIVLKRQLTQANALGITKGLSQNKCFNFLL